MTSSDAFKTFIRQAQRRATAAGVRLPMQKLREALALACYDRGYSACLAAIAAGAALGPPLPPRYVGKAAERFDVDPNELNRALCDGEAPVPEDSVLPLPALAPSRCWLALGVAGSGKTTLAIGMAEAFARTGGAAIYISFAHEQSPGALPAIERHVGLTAASARMRLAEWLRGGAETPAFVILDDLDHCDAPNEIDDVIAPVRRAGATCMLLAQSELSLPDAADHLVILEPEMLPRSAPALASFTCASPGGSRRSYQRGLLQGFVVAPHRALQRFALPVADVRGWFA
ncbi:hypothetical protein [Aquimonas sp.]|jgi:hypothetical protein|uniref:hypothetical protein n=1 Tax=Aquimonas sp. TaxID=1872588 RepID=UPI0037BE9B9C